MSSSISISSSIDWFLKLSNSFVNLLILDFNDKILSLKYKNSYFEVPHKNLATRNFVLFPLQEILPNWKHPKTKEFIGTLIQTLSAEHRKAILKIKKNWYN